nr:hypothetical protein CFP56_71805 [Quercus suber]
MGGTNPNRPLKIAWVWNRNIADFGIPCTIIRRVIVGMFKHYLLEHQSFVHIRILLSVRKSGEPLTQEKKKLVVGGKQKCQEIWRAPAENIKKKSDFGSNRRNILKHKANFKRVLAGNWGQLVKFAHLNFGGKELVHQLHKHGWML